MFGWFRSKDQRSADKVLVLLAHAIREVHPNRFVFEPTEAGLFTQPKLSQLNRLLGRDESRKFAAVAFDDLVAMTSKYGRNGLVAELGAAIAHDAVLIALVSAAKHVMYGRARLREVRQRAEQLLRYVNARADPAAAQLKPSRRT
jgi:hypothetical protein